jgi:hypothetical protein
MNERYRRQNQIIHNSCHSWVVLGRIYPNRVYLVTYISSQYALFCLVFKMADNGKVMYDIFSKKSDHSTEWVQIIKDFLY